MIVFIIVIFKKTHAGVELRGWIKGEPICEFFRDDRYVEWKCVKNEAGIVTDKNYGAFIVNEKGAYIDKTTKNIVLPFVADIGTSINMNAAKLADDLQYIIKDEKKLWALRTAIANNQLSEDESVKAIKSSVQLSSIKHMLTALIPHNINAKIEKTIAARMKSLGNVNVMQVIFLFIAIFGAVVLGAIMLKNVLNK
jgi:hypothetical protein